jgi:hypothetical protein
MDTKPTYDLYQGEKTLTTQEQVAIQYQVNRQPKNPLFLHADGQDIQALDILTDESLWPSDRLPRKSDRKAFWLPMRDYGKDWKPELAKADLMPHAGADFLFMVWLISKKYLIS